MGYDKFHLVILLLQCYLSTSSEGSELTNAIAKPHPKVCLDIRITIFEVPGDLDNQALTSCEVIIGSLIYAPMPSTANSTSADNNLITFPYLREIYGYMLLGYSSQRTFASIFPRLAIIHGRELYQGYALIIMENLQLDEIGLTSLINIRRGNVIVARNAQLCYANSIQWSEIVENKKAQVILRQNREQCAFCPNCPAACWSPGICQKQCSVNCKGNCLSDSICCPDQCVGGCYFPTSSSNTTQLVCNACRKMRIYATGNCVEQCPNDMFQILDSLCVTREECVSFYNGVGCILEESSQCLATCPPGFHLSSSSRCVRCISTPENNYCGGACRDQHIRSIDDFVNSKYCSRVYTLNIYNIVALESTNNNLQEVFSAFQSLEQIDYEFTIHNVNVFSTLSIFSKLRQIGISPNATMTIEENDFLTELWLPSQSPPVVKGTLNIVRNARLCSIKIDEFLNFTLSHEPTLQIVEHSRNKYANGYLASCESNLLTLSFTAIQSETAQVIVAVPQELFFRPGGQTDHLRRPFLSVYYKISLKRNETHFDATQSHKWLRIVEKANYNPSSQGGSFTMNVGLQSLVGDTWYAVYASITSNVNTVGLYSTIGYFRTLSRQPEPVLNLRGDALSESSIELMWQPPSRPNGVISVYLIYYAPLEERLPVNDLNLLCLMKDRWKSEIPVAETTLATNNTTRCTTSKGKTSDFDDLTDVDFEKNIGIDQVITDLAILEHQLINSLTQRKEPLFIRPDLKDTIIKDLDNYFEDKSSANNEQYSVETNQQEKAPVEHSPFILTFNQTSTLTRIRIDNLKRAQMYMFQVYACQDITQKSKGEACSLNGILITVRTRPGDPSLDLVRNVQFIPAIDPSTSSLTESKPIEYRISWLEPMFPNGLIHFYTIRIDQDSHSGLKDERCLGRDIHSINVTLLPKTKYRLQIITYTAARLNREFDDQRFNTEEIYPSNRTNAFYQVVFTTIELPSRELTRQNRIVSLLLIIGSIVLLSMIVFGAPFYYYRYIRSDSKASISKNPNYELYTPDQWEIDKDSVTLEKLIGQGHFGQVYKGILKLSDGSYKTCAVKIRTTHPTDLLQEASIMKQFQCYHVIQLYGICSRIRPPYVVMELMENGDLKNYLYRHRRSELNPNGPSLDEAAMIQLALDVADGMYYLSDQKFVHRDLAARNCLVNGNHTCKVGDFGLTRDIYETDYYRRGGRSFLPIRWMAPESLRDGRFDTVSDVWSFGVLLWEIATLAEQPYQGYGNEEVVHYVRYGNITLERPASCPEILHRLMRACWTYSPSERISFRAIVKELVVHENEDFRLHAYYHSQPHSSTTTTSSLVESQTHDEEELLLGDQNDGEDGQKPV